MQQIFLLHSAGPQGAREGSSGLVSWLKQELGSEYELMHPIMPHPDNPDYEPWKLQLDEELKNLEGDVIMIGHSLGGSVLLKYLASTNLHFNITSLHLCAAPFWGKDDAWQYQPFTLAPDFAESLPDIGKIRLYHSVDDPIVPFRHAQLYRDELTTSVLHAIEGDSHAFENGIGQLAKEIR